jgi:hypothetical protein
MDLVEWVRDLHRLADHLAETGRDRSIDEALASRHFLSASEARRLANRLDEIVVLRETGKKAT